MQDQHIKKEKTSHKEETSRTLSHLEPRPRGHQEHQSQTLRTLLSTQIDSKNNLKEDPNLRNTPRVPNDRWRPWTQEEHLKLVTLIRNKGPQWKELASHYQNRQREEVKRHCLTRLKKIIEKMISHRRRRGQFNPRAMFRELRGLMEEMSQGRFIDQDRVLKSRELIANMLTYDDLEMKDQSPRSKEGLKELSQLLRDFKKVTKKRGSQASTSVMLSRTDNSSENGYSSDCSSFFEQSIHGQCKPQAEAKPESKEEDENQCDDKQKPKRKQVVLEENAQIRNFLLGEGLLEFQNSRQRGAGSRGSEVFFSGDQLQNESYQHFCNRCLIQMSRRSQRVAIGGNRLSASRLRKSDKP